uniref:Uncharacterized protein n=1 Tax=Candidatus Kentrum sp. UNK TaxID=2126344 RepID=A0A451B1Q3_9GAMM|nr:MAG: hypothetical protein BECKUNK1418G_GA0071005_110614 [Candidatus Kentron sp. UNK]VFK72201.1 MAG: hypothetical protein BECKUNK1418H_GA0071006_11017 [Candidatus Kentron sp. UNK]
MSFDPTTIVIVAALIGAGIFFFVEFILRKDIEVINSAIIFLAIYAISQGYLLIETALSGDPDNLPKAWRGYLGLAGVIVIGLSLRYIIKTSQKITARFGNEKIDNE